VLSQIDQCSSDRAKCFSVPIVALSQIGIVLSQIDWCSPRSISALLIEPRGLLYRSFFINIIMVFSSSSPINLSLRLPARHQKALVPFRFQGRSLPEVASVLCERCKAVFYERGNREQLNAIIFFPKQFPVKMPAGKLFVPFRNFFKTNTHKSLLILSPIQPFHTHLHPHWRHGASGTSLASAPVVRSMAAMGSALSRAPLG
jgi:hypothetical protein